MRRWAAALLIVLLGRTVVWPDIAHTSTITLSACREVIREDLGAIGSRVTVTRCASEFSVSDPHIVLFVSIGGVDYEQDAAVELTDPDTVNVMRATFVLEPEAGEPTSFTFATILPVATPPREVAAKYPRMPVIRVSGKPVRERTGEWTWKVTLGRGSPSTMKFRLRP